MKSSMLRLFFVATFALFGTACDKSGLYPLFSKTDVLVPCGPGATTWLRTTTMGTEILILGSATPASASMPMEQRCYTHAIVTHDSSTESQSGSYTLTASGSGTASYSSNYDFNYTSTGAILSRRGAQREDFVTPRSIGISLAMNGAKLAATIDGVAGTYTNIYDVIAGLDPESQSGAEDIFCLINLPLFTSQVRIPGFGGAGMTAYKNTTTFYSAIGGAEVGSMFTIGINNVYSMPDTTFMYTAFEDLSGIVYSGPQRTIVSLAGNGDMTGALDFTLRDGPASTDVAVRGKIDYENVKIENGVAGDGDGTNSFYTLSFTSPAAGPFDVSYAFASDIDLRNILPQE